MIIFSPIVNLPVELLEQKGIRQVVKYNLSSYFMEGQNLTALVPSAQNIPENVLSGDCSDASFDIEYHNYIMSNNEAFIQFMNIMITAFTQVDTLVQILIQSSNFRDIITESLMKLIQQRYGYNTYFINDIEDFVYVEEQEFSIPGLFAMDGDIARWQSLVSPDYGEEYE